MAPCSPNYALGLSMRGVGRGNGISMSMGVFGLLGAGERHHLRIGKWSEKF